MRNCLQEPREQKHKELQITQQQTGLERDWQGANVQITGASNTITETRKTQNEKLRLPPTNTWALPHENIYEKNKKRRGWRNFELNQFYSKGTDKGKCAWVYQVLVRLNPLLFRERAKLRRYTLTQLLEKQRKFHICTFDHKISHYVGMKDEDVHVRTVGKAQARFQLQTVWLQEWSFFPLSHASSLKTRSWFVEGFFFNVLFTFSNLKKKIQECIFWRVNLAMPLTVLPADSII